MNLRGKRLVRSIVKLALAKKALDLTVINLKRHSNFTDYFVICSASVPQHVKAIADHIIQQLRLVGLSPLHQDGLTALQWVALDYGEIIVHIFLPQTREFYLLEKLWGDAPREVFSEQKHK